MSDEITIEGRIKDIKAVTKYTDDGKDEYWNIKIEAGVGRGRVTIKTYTEPSLNQGEKIIVKATNNQTRLTQGDP